MPMRNGTPTVGIEPTYPYGNLLSKQADYHCPTSASSTRKSWRDRDLRSKCSVCVGEYLTEHNTSRKSLLLMVLSNIRYKRKRIIIVTFTYSINFFPNSRINLRKISISFIFSSNFSNLQYIGSTNCFLV